METQPIQTKPSLDSIFGSSQPLPNKPPLDAILGIGTKPTAPTLGENIVTDLKKRGEAILTETGELQDTIKTAQTSQKNIDVLHGLIKPFETTLRNAGQVAGGIADVISNTVGYMIPEEYKAKAGELFKDAVGQEGLQALSKGVDTYTSWAEKNPNVAKDLEAVFNIASVVPVAKAPVATAGVARDLTVGLVQKGSKVAKKVNPFERATEVMSDPEVYPFIASSPANAKKVTEAVKQGFEVRDVKFLSTLNEADKPALREMADLAETGAGDLRAQYAGKRPADVVGDSVLTPLREIQKINAKAGADVDNTARSLAGSEVDGTAVRATAMTDLEKAGVKINPQTGKLDFSESVFKKTPALVKQLELAFSDLPTGMIDAYDLHKFKKSLDEIVNYGSAGEGIKGTAERLIKSVRASADEVLDSNFEAYNKANTDFRVTREVLDNAEEVIGGKTDFISSNANMQIGKAMRGLFANTNKRPELFNMLQKVQETAGKYGIDVSSNPVDQALFAQVLESVYGNVAITGLQGEVGKAVKTAVDLARSPTETLINKGIEKIDKLQNITPEQKRKALRAFLEDNTPLEGQKLPVEVSNLPETKAGTGKGLRGFFDPMYMLRDEKGKFAGVADQFSKAEYDTMVNFIDYARGLTKPSFDEAVKLEAKAVIFLEDQGIKVPNTRAKLRDAVQKVLDKANFPEKK